MDTLYLQRWSEIIGTTTKNGIVFVATSNWKLFKSQYGEVEDNIIIYIERLKT